MPNLAGTEPVRQVIDYVAKAEDMREDHLEPISWLRRDEPAAAVRA
ncbi:hypothetical protein [Streptomyces spiramyceticus]|nr:hypothetical protein [Streptomyces spiramyceticus]